jgi:hypothetical protein
MAKFFDLTKINSLDELKKQYHSLALKYHPDREGGSTELFQALQLEFETLTDNYLKNQKFTASDAKNEIIIDETIKAIIMELMEFETIKIELVGTWIWISGNTYPIKDVLKKLNFKFAPVKKMWYLNTTGEKIRSKGDKTIDQIRNKYGSTEIKDRRGKLNGKRVTVSRKVYTKLSKLIRLVRNRKKYSSKI